ncbi:hypothetical protein [Streptomyces tricolor]|uniref:hypothetical protein n=1 Tax=Streptomyces tricolor TaxID=68277 RepID=UPI003D726DB8
MTPITGTKGILPVRSARLRQDEADAVEGAEKIPGETMHPGEDMTGSAEYGVAVQEDEVADERVDARTHDRHEALDALYRTPYTRRYLVQRTDNGWVEADRS